MPTYEYACKSCGEHLEVVQSFKDGALTECPACGGDLRKVFGNIGIAFKGSGFYKTDSRSEAKKTGSGKAAKVGEAAKAGEAASSGPSASSGSSGSSAKEGPGGSSPKLDGAASSSSGPSKSSKVAAAS